ncbi:hypothetical protein [Eleftheria terrae]|uniref:hypothetical protein n=1 Tax=Eleftheria terrae TaxID=1597781 RepID=UPI00263BA622|nr:hypothetical protein [Eleftheria terrae]WKB53032.1 hypothetical protein N7L95_01095 [Eleftheria terrae]
MKEVIQDVIETAIDPALALLPDAMDSNQARVMLVAVGLQESRLRYRRQNGGGPARGLWQFERGTLESQGGVWGVYLHRASRFWLNELCKARRVDFDPDFIYDSLEDDDVLAAGVARLLLFTDPHPLPAVTDELGAWDLYAKRTWRPGKPHRSTWAGFHRAAREAVLG